MYLILILKTLFMYIFIIFICKFVEKKEVGELNILDFIIYILIAELIAISINKDNIIISIIPIIVLIISQFILKYIILKNNEIVNIIDRKPIIIIKNGKLNFKEMSKLKYSLDDLLTKLKINGIKSIDKVKYAVLEKNGDLSIFNDNSDCPLPIILNGVIDYDVLKKIKKDYEWLLNILRKKNLELNEVFYAFYKEGKTFIIKKSELL